MKSVGEVMAIGRTFQESLQKALRGLETGLDGLGEVLTLPLTDESTNKLAYELRSPGANRLLYVGDAFRAGWSLQKVYELTHIDPWFLVQIEDLIKEEARVRAEGLAAPQRRTPARAQAQGLLRQPPGQAHRRGGESHPHQAPRAGHRAGVQARGHVRGRIRHVHGLPVLHLRGGVRGSRRPRSGRS